MAADHTPMRVLSIASLRGVFVKDEVRGLKRLGIKVELVVKDSPSLFAYLQIPALKLSQGLEIAHRVKTRHVWQPKTSGTTSAPATKALSPDTELDKA